MALRIEFLGKEWRFGGDSLEEDGSIATEAAYQAGEVSYAHLCEDGIVRRYNRQIGTRADIKILGPLSDHVADPLAFFAGILGSSWRNGQ